MQNLETLSYVIMQSRDGIEPFPIAAFAMRHDAESFLRDNEKYSSNYRFHIETN